jgi:uncharacterized protein YcfJ
MKKAFIAMSLLVALNSAYASSEYFSTVKSAECTLVAKTGGTTGAIAGGAIGATAGAVAGKALFGRKYGGLLGGLAGGAVGGTVGENIASTKTYNCIVRFTAQSGKEAFAETTGQEYIVGQQVKVYDSEGRYLIK